MGLREADRSLVAELEKPLSEAFLIAMESVYMFEVIEKDYFAFDN